MEEINSTGRKKLFRALTCLHTSSFGAFLSASIIDLGFFLRSSATFCQYFPVDIPHSYTLVIGIHIYSFKNIGIMKPNFKVSLLNN
jgi:hypothetical protein